MGVRGYAPARLSSPLLFSAMDSRGGYAVRDRRSHTGGGTRPSGPKGKDDGEIVNVNYPVPSELHYIAKQTAEHLGITLKEFVWQSLQAKVDHHAAEVAAAPVNPYKRGFRRSA